MLPVIARAGTALATTVAKKNPVIVARLTKPVQSVVATFSDEVVKTAARNGLNKGVLFGSSLALGFDALLDKVMNNPSEVQAEASELITKVEDPKARAALVDLVNELAAMGVEGIDFDALSPEAAYDVVVQTSSDRVYGIPKQMTFPTAAERADEIRRQKLYASLRKVFSVQQIHGLLMLHDIAVMPNRRQVLDYMEEDHARLRSF